MMAKNDDPFSEERLAHLRLAHARTEMLKEGLGLLGNVVEKLPDLFGHTGQAAAEAAEQADSRFQRLRKTLSDLAQAGLQQLRRFAQEAGAAEHQIRKMQLVMDVSAKTIVDAKYRPLEGLGRIKQAHQLAEWYQDKTEKTAAQSFLTGDEASAATTRMMSLSNQLGHASMQQRVTAGITIAELTKVLMPAADAAAQGREIQAIFKLEGLESSEVAKRLNLTRQELEVARKKGELVHLVLERTRHLDTLRQQANGDYVIQAGLFHSRIQGLQATMGQGMTRHVALGIAAINRMLASKDVAGFANAVGQSLSRLSGTVIRPLAGLLVNLGHRAARLGTELVRILGPSLERLATSFAGFITTYFPMLMSIAETILPVLAQGFAGVIDRVASFFSYISNPSGLAVFLAAVLAAFRFGSAITSLMTFTGRIRLFLRVLSGVSGALRGWGRLIILLGRAQRLFGAIRLAAGLMGGLAPHAGLVAAAGIAMHAAYRWSRDQREQRDLATHGGIGAVETRRSSQLRLAQRSGLAQRLFAGQATDADRRLMHQFDPSVQMHLRNHVIRDQGKSPKVHAPITLGAITLPPGSLIDEQKVTRMVAGAQAKQQQELVRLIRNGGRSANPGAAYA
jgi:hypothetical protein